MVPEKRRKRFAVPPQIVFYKPRNYDGQQHFVKTKDRSFWMSQKDIQGIKYRDSIKNKYAKRKTIKLIRIKYTKFNKIDEILEKELKEWQKILPLSI